MSTATGPRSAHPLGIERGLMRLETTGDDAWDIKEVGPLTSYFAVEGLSSRGASGR